MGKWTILPKPRLLISGDKIYPSSCVSFLLASLVLIGYVSFDRISLVLNHKKW